MKSPWGMEIAVNMAGSIYAVTGNLGNLNFSVFCAGFRKTETKGMGIPKQQA